MGIWIAAAFTTVFCGLIGWPLLRSWSKGDRACLWAFGLAIPLSPAVNLLVKKPLIAALRDTSQIADPPPDWPFWFAWLVLLSVGVCEEGTKLVPLLLARVRRSLRQCGSAVPMAFAIGLGFAAGEIWYVAWRISVSDPASAALPFYLLGGFVSERLATVFVHSFLSFVALSGWLRGRGQFALFVVASMLLHAAADVAPMLYQMKRIGAGMASLILFPLLLLCVLPFYWFGRRARPEPFKPGRVLYERDSPAREERQGTR